MYKVLSHTGSAWVSEALVAIQKSYHPTAGVIEQKHENGVRKGEGDRIGP